jgi:hypothetical protein
VGLEDRQFPESFTSQYGRLRRLGFLLTGDWAQAEDLAQETLVRRTASSSTAGCTQEPSRTEQQASLFCVPSRGRATAGLISGYGSSAVGGWTAPPSSPARPRAAVPSRGRAAPWPARRATARRRPTIQAAPEGARAPKITSPAGSPS